MKINNHNNIETLNMEKFSNTTYNADSICHSVTSSGTDYFDFLLEAKLKMVSAYSGPIEVLDLCCGSGEHLLSLAHLFQRGTGVDFTEEYINRASKLCAETKTKNIEFFVGNARKIQAEDNSFDLIYSFSSLYCIPNVGEVICEVGRLLKAGGFCILDMGNLYSLNSVVCKAYPELVHPCHIPVREMRQQLRAANLSIIKHRSFQILPLWGQKPKWLRPLLHPIWKRLLQKKVQGRMLDEWISNLPVVQSLAFRHIFICLKSQC